MTTIDKFTIEEVYDHFDLEIDKKEVDKFEKFFYKFEEKNKILVALRNALNGKSSGRRKSSVLSSPALVLESK